jgi:hypothetical protein
MGKKSTTDSPRQISVAWPPFAERLAKVLAALEEDQYLILSAKHSGHYVQFAAQGSYGMRAETTSNAFLKKAEKLGKSKREALVKLGWRKPTNKPGKATPERDPDGSSNFFAEFPAPVAYDQIARQAVATLSDIFGIPHPGMLAYEASDLQGTQIALPALELKSSRRGEDQPVPDQSANLSALLLETMRSVTGIADLGFDDDGDIGVRFGSAVTFARVIGEPPIVHWFSPVLRDVPEQSGILERLNLINSQARQMRVFWRDGAVFAVAETAADPFVVSHVENTYKQFCRVVDDLDDLLQGEFGGKTAYQEWMPSTARH